MSCVAYCTQIQRNRPKVGSVSVSGAAYSYLSLSNHLRHAAKHTRQLKRPHSIYIHLSYLSNIQKLIIFPSQISILKMRFSKLSLALAIAGANAINLTDTTYAGIAVGTPFDITWAGAVGDVTVILLNDADPNNNTPYSTIATGQTGTSYEWTPESTIPAGDYAIKVADSVTSNYGAQFQLVGATASLSLTSSSAVSATTTSTGGSTTSTGSSTITSSSNPTSSTSSTSSSSKSSSTSASKTTSSAPAETTTLAPLSSANSLASPLAFVFLALTAIITLN